MSLFDARNCGVFSSFRWPLLFHITIRESCTKKKVFQPLFNYITHFINRQFDILWTCNRIKKLTREHAFRRQIIIIAGNIDPNEKRAIPMSNFFFTATIKKITQLPSNWCLTNTKKRRAGNEIFTGKLFPSRAIHIFSNNIPVQFYARSIYNRIWDIEIFYYRVTKTRVYHYIILAVNNLWIYSKSFLRFIINIDIF